MPTRTIPTVFPAIRERDVFTRKRAKARLLRDIAQAQNFIWANAYRVYATMAYEGNGNTQTINVVDPAEGVAPDGNGGAICVAAFAVPKNWGPSQRLKVQGRSTLTNVTTHTRGHIYVVLYELDNSFAGVYSLVDYNANGNNDWNVEIQIPQDRTVQVQVWMRSDFDAGEAGTATHQVKFISARYQLPTATEMGGDAATIGWTALAHAAADYLPLSAGMLVPLVRDTRSLYAMRPPEICQTYLANNYNNTSTFAEVGRYVVYVPPLITTVTGKLVVWCTNGGANNEVRVLLGGVVQQTFLALAAGETELAVTAFNVVANAENTITIEARSTAASADWGTIVIGRTFWEEGTNLALPGGTTVPAAYAPVDEAEVFADKSIVDDLSGAARAGLKKLQQNNTWLARHRLRWLIGDWCHRALKRIDTDILDKGAASTQAYRYWDFTRGPESVNHQIYHPKNITLRGTSSTEEAQDGFGAFPNGYMSSVSPTQTEQWPAPQTFARHGRRVGRWRTDSGTGTTPIALEAGARLRWMGRGRRLMPAYLRNFYEFATLVGGAVWIGSGPNTGPNAEHVGYCGRGYFTLRSSGIDAMTLPLPGTLTGVPGAAATTANNEDLYSRWYGPSEALHANVGTNFNVDGRIPVALWYEPYPSASRAEGTVYELELQASIMWDRPLMQADIDALT